MSNKVPQIRFNGYSDDWEERKLGDVVGEIQSGNRLPKDSLTNGDVPYVVAQTKNDGVFTKIARGTLDYNGKPMKLFPGNSISFSIDNPEAMFYRNAEFYTSNIMRVIHEDHLTHEQYVFILENMKRFIRGYDWSRKFSGPVVSNLEYLQPSEEEQQKIGSFFKQLDDTITLHQRKLDLLKEQKKGYLQKMFPKNGAKVPELRFAGFADDWEERKLSDLTESHNSGVYIPKDQYGEGTNIIGVGDIYDSDVVDGQRYRLAPVKDKRFILHTNDLLYGESSLVPEGIARVVSVSEAGAGTAFAWHTRRFKVNQVTLNSRFLGLELDYWLPARSHLMRSSTKTALTGITTQDFFNTQIVFPSKPEQEKIATLINSLDTAIALHQRKLDLLKEQKKGFLQKMFV
ncbi:hypothetical protein GJ664_10025 (plasmid) [Latilactobacillus sakei]|uniref:restriction endonuclease subunit S n=1 Tax=Latilactobacillus sakei TaxID=1599 RepID=UPI0012B0029F|nr:restriction endonuclease subunit S [Latilactobacillus sakei]QGL61706.1 hypothetical protein GJ664_10025 [Latilactobacillus sakei]